MGRTLGEAIRFYVETLERLRILREEDTGRDVERSRRLRKAYDKIEGGLDGLESATEWE